jgi:hypothetical protein
MAEDGCERADVDWSAVRRGGLAVLAVIACSACGLSPAIRTEAERVSTLIDTENGSIARKEAGYRAFAASSANLRYRIYADREAWAKQFDHARVKTGAARATYQRYVVPLLRRNNDQDEHAVAIQIAQIARLVSEADAYADLPERRRQYVDSISSTYARVARESDDEAGKVKAEADAVLTIGDRTKRAFPARAADIDKRIGPLLQLADATANANRKVSFETANTNARRAADFVVLGDNARLVSRDASKVHEDARTVGAQLESLSHSYSKTLADMKAAYSITVQRWSWNDSADSPPVHTYTYPRRDISGEAFDYFNSLPETLPYAARYSSSAFFGSAYRTHERVDQDRWTALGIASQEAWVDRDDTAEYGYTLSGQYFHKYLTTDNDQAQEADWQSVDETMFEEHVDDLGMDMLAKPFGAFEDEKVANPTPAGLAFVGNPGYGQWQTDDRGTSFWVWYGRYRLFSDLLGIGGQPYYYRQDEWNTWNTRYRGQPYYGQDKDNRERYGTHGYVVGSSGRYASRIPEMRRVAIRHGGGAAIGRGGVQPIGK